MTINALGKSDGIQNLKITDLHRLLLFDSSKDPALLAGVDDVDDKDTSFAGVHNEDTSFAGMHNEETSFVGVPVPNTTVMTNADDDSDTESDHNSIDTNEADDNSSKASVHSTGTHISLHSATGEPPQHPPDEEEPGNIEQPKLEIQVPVLCQSGRVSVPPSEYIP